MVCWAPAKLLHCKLKRKGCLLITKAATAGGSGSFFLPLYGNAGMINNQHISVTTFVLHSLKLLGCHLFIWNLSRNKDRNRWCGNPWASGEVIRLGWNICNSYYSRCLLHENISLQHKRSSVCFQVNNLSSPRSVTILVSVQAVRLPQIQSWGLLLAMLQHGQLCCCCLFLAAVFCSK